MNNNASKHPLLIEIGVEEIPSNVMVSTLKQLTEVTGKRLSSALIPGELPQVFATPRRLILFIPDLAPQQETRHQDIIGPPKRAAFDRNGQPTPAAIGFARSQGVSLSEIKVQPAEALGKTAKGKKGEYLVYKKSVGGAETKKLLSEIIPGIISGLTFPRSMRWNKTAVLFVRPIRWILALYDGDLVPFSYAGVPSADRSYGHHMMAPEPFQVRDFESYQETLRCRFVIIDPEERVRLIKKQIDALAREKSGELKTDDPLVLEAAHTVEYPKAVCGGFDRTFLEIPKEITTTAMVEHQGFFPLYNEKGDLLPHFITISNTDAEDMSIIQKGNERVLRARLVDAQFYFDQDRKISLIDRVEALKQVTFQEKLGSYYDKVERLIPLSKQIQKDLFSQSEVPEAALAAKICKCDLLTGVVREFPSLQGVIGRIYAQLEGKEDSIAKAMEEHYLPSYSGGPMPKSAAGQILAIADKLDTLVGCFGLGLIPSGSEDPYALRRQGLGIIQILLDDHKFDRFSLQDAIQNAIEQYEKQGKFHTPDLEEKILGFFKRRLDSYLQALGIRYDLRDAVLAGPLIRPWNVLDHVEALVPFSKHPLFGSLVIIFKRVDRILPEGFVGKLDKNLLSHSSEKQLYEIVCDVGEALGSLLATKNYDAVLERLTTLYDPLHLFFEDVLVMDKDESIRHNRLSLLFEVGKLFKRFGDFGKIVLGKAEA